MMEYWYMGFFLFIGSVCVSGRPGALQLGAGTTTNIRGIFIGRCDEYQNTERVIKRRNCSEVFNAFLEGFIHKDPCHARRSDYRKYMELTLQEVPRDKSMFWSGVQEFVYQFTNKGKRYIGIGDQLLGYPVNGLSWCSASIPRPLTCPACENSSQMQFWREVSTQFARAASGVVTVMLNGSRDGPAFYNNSVFAEYELPFLRPYHVTELHVYLVHDIGKKKKETCSSDSLTSLRTLAMKILGGDKKFIFKCIDDPERVVLLLCVDHPQSPTCRLRMRTQMRRLTKHASRDNTGKKVNFKSNQIKSNSISNYYNI